jgi:uncharacterized membrane protein YkvA (DUF1232 family)
MNKHKLKRMFSSFVTKAQNLAHNKDQTQLKIREAFDKATTNKGALAEVWHKLQLLLGLTKDYANGSYLDVDRKTMVSIIAGLLYFISPIDLIPDFLVGIGLIDDAFIIGYIYSKVANELVKYEAWKNKKNVIHI